MPALYHKLLWAAIGLVSLATAEFSSPLSPSNGPRKFELSLTWETYNADGLPREMILVNGQFPGPVLEMNQDEEIEILVHNRLPFNTTVHYHGMPGPRASGYSAVR